MLVLAFCAQVLGGEVSFRNDVMAVLSKSGCNLGTCHGNATGKGGFKLSLRGDDPATDFNALVRGEQGRRINLANPEQSLILMKATMQIPHQGGRRFDAESAEYGMLLEWISRGAVADRTNEVQLVELQVEPREAILVEPDWSQQISVNALFSDGSQRDVTSLAVYEMSEPVAAVSAGGRVSAERAGELTVGVRFLDEQQAVRLAFVPDVDASQWQFPTPQGEIDRFVFRKLAQVRIPAARVCDDVTFVRRVTLDLAGRLPTAQESREFVSSKLPEKRKDLIERLLSGPGFDAVWALKWADLLRAEENTLDRKGVENLYAWLRHQFSERRGLDEICSELIASDGSTYSSPASNYYRAMRDPVTRAESTAQMMLGIRLQCAKCHNHPFDRWTQDDYYGWSSVFAGVDYKILDNRRRDRNNKHEFVGEQIVFRQRGRRVKDPRTGEEVPPLILDESAALGADADPLQVLANWLVDEENPFFAKVQVNRIWAHMLGRGIVDPIDDFRLTNAASHPELLDWLAAEFVQHDYDVRHMVRLIANSATYQLDSKTNELNGSDEKNFSHGIVRRPSAEQLLDNIVQVTGVPVRFNGYPEGMRASEIPGVRAVRVRDESPSDADKFLVLFGKPVRLQPCECERSSESTLAQTFQMVSGELIDRQLSNSRNVIHRLSREGLSAAEIVEELYWSALSRGPSARERELIARRLSRGEEANVLEDVLWGLLNSNEFLLRR